MRIIRTPSVPAPAEADALAGDHPNAGASFAVEPDPPPDDSAPAPGDAGAGDGGLSPGAPPEAEPTAPDLDPRDLKIAELEGRVGLVADLLTRAAADEGRAKAPEDPEPQVPPAPDIALLFQQPQAYAQQQAAREAALSAHTDWRVRQAEARVTGRVAERDQQAEAQRQASSTLDQFFQTHADLAPKRRAATALLKDPEFRAQFEGYERPVAWRLAAAAIKKELGMPQAPPAPGGAAPTPAGGRPAAPRPRLPQFEGAAPRGPAGLQAKAARAAQAQDEPQTTLTDILIKRRERRAAAEGRGPAA